ncbi:sensor domain-containing protein [Tsukamurella sp. 8F]|uniref:sensor histidine kinase n=1 Tax=unclassified Tsukamurella TaxID=2633480 RepID=UPI0023B9FF79|nr:MULTISPECIES: sensor histidine kinase [unclassified Tsukamurella]MDF0528564.1 sensor domain-containing protein [Tsukamurella sp. 8J]MDF0585526.1 sensor domain-containing protein [Tsukamurella sp. 8F]
MDTTTDPEPDLGAVWRPLAHPIDYLDSSRPWRAVAYSLVTAVLAAITAGLVLSILLIPLLPLWAYILGRLDRVRVTLLGTERIADPHRPVAGPLIERCGARLGEGATWRETVYVVAIATLSGAAALAAMLFWAMAGALVVSPLLVRSEPIDVWRVTVTTSQQAVPLAVAGLLLVPVGLWLHGLLAAVESSLAVWLLGPTQGELARRVAGLETSRSVLVDSFEGERQRIERDLHDGPQQDLVGLAMTLGEMEAELGERPEPRAQLATAQAQLDRALASLRAAVRGVHPAVLTDRGVAAAVAELGGPSLPVTVVCGEGWSPGLRLPPAVEATMYFTASEAVTNAAKHGAATAVSVALDADRDGIRMTITDDGAGGADPDAGSGLAGLVERAATVGAELHVFSPQGGPTTLAWRMAG